MNIPAVRQTINAMSKKFGGKMHLELHDDGSGFIRDYLGNIIADFDGLGELSELLDD